MSLSAIKPGGKIPKSEIDHIQNSFLKNGYYELGPLLETEEIEALHQDMKRKWDDPQMHEPS